VRERLRGELTCEAVVVGGGLAGCASAFVFAQAGIKTVLVEADRLGQASTSGGPGVFDPGAGSRFIDLRERHGLRVARHMWEAERHASLEMQALIRRLRIRCDLERLDVSGVAMFDNEATALEREHRALTEAGFEAALITGRRVKSASGLDGRALLKRSDAGAADPYRLAIELARHAERRRAKLFERTPATRIKFGRKAVEVTTASGVVRADVVIVASDTLRPNVRALQRHLRQVDTTVAVMTELPAPLRRELGAADSVLHDCAALRRGWRVDSRGSCFVWQSGQAPAAERQRDQATVQRIGQLMYEFSVLHPVISGARPTHGWTSSSHRSADGLVIAGPHRAFPRHLFAVGLGVDGLQGAYLAARLNLRHYQGAPEKGDELFGFIR
jgi:glycine/D-amino acid oxidase-like deaminating enzyme